MNTIKKIIALLLGFVLIGCAEVPMNSNRKAATPTRKGVARVTAYNPFERDKIRIRRGSRYVWKWIRWGWRTASGAHAIQGVTCAASKKFPIGTKVYFPQLKGIIGNGNFIVQDRGAGSNIFHTSEWFDIFVENKTTMRQLQYGMPEWMQYETY